MTNQEINQERRRFLVLATAGAAGVGALGVATPFVASFFPSEKAKAAGAPIDIDVSKIEAGQLVTAEWRGKPIWVLNRTEQQLKDLPSLNAELVDPSSTAADQQPEYCQNELRSIKGKDNIWVAIGICTHLGCSPTYRPDVGAADLGGGSPRSCRFGCELEGRFLLPLPRLQIRLGRPRVQRRAGTVQSGDSSL